MSFASSITATTTSSSSSTTFTGGYGRLLNPFALRNRLRLRHHIRCSSSSGPSRGFGSQSTKKSDEKANKGKLPREEQRNRKSSTKQPGITNRAPLLNPQIDGKPSNIPTELEFEERLKAVKRSARQLKKVDVIEQYGAIDYDAPVESEAEPKTIGLGTKIGAGVAVLIFGLVFALGDFLPTGSDSPSQVTTVTSNQLSEKEKQTIQTRLQQFEATLASSPEDPTALEGAAVSLAELGEYSRAASYLDDLTKKKPHDPDAFRLLGEVKYELKDYEGSASAYRRSAMEYGTDNFEVLWGLTNSLLSAKKPDEAVQVLLATRDRLKSETSDRLDTNSDGSTTQTGTQQVDPIQVELLLGKAYSDWGHISDAVSVYDQLISSHPEDFRGYLAKGIVLKQNGRAGEAERMFIQARFYAGNNAKSLVDRCSKQ